MKKTIYSGGKVSYVSSVKLTKHKYFECQLDIGDFGQTPRFDFNVRLSSKSDHAGFRFFISFFKMFFFMIVICDHRHWDYANDCWASDGLDKPSSRA
jgi:hypothetical protein